LLYPRTRLTQDVAGLIDPLTQFPVGITPTVIDQRNLFAAAFDYIPINKLQRRVIAPGHRYLQRIRRSRDSCKRVRAIIHGVI